MLYRLSYFRSLRLMYCGRRWIRTTEGINQQIYSLPHLATLVFALISIFLAAMCSLLEPLVGFGTNDPEITNHVLWPTELKYRQFLSLCAADSLAALASAKVMQDFELCKHFYNKIVTFFLCKH